MKPYYCILVIIFILNSCGKGEAEDLTTEIPNSDPVKIEKVTNVTSRPGRNRLQLSWHEPANLGEIKISKFRVFWNNGNDSLEIKANSGADSTLVLINDLKEAQYLFSIYAYDKNGNKSAGASISEKTYGSQYEASLQNRQIISAFSGGIKDVAVVKWGQARAGALGSEILFYDITSTFNKLYTSVDEAMTILEDIKVDNIVTNRTLFVPQENAIDTFYTAFVPIKISSLTDQSLVIDALEGPITQNEILKFKDYMNSKVPAVDYGGFNNWAYKNPGKAMEACGLMYESTKDIDILNRMIYYADAALAGRNDLAPVSEGGQRLTWTGAVEPVWTSDLITVETGIKAGIEQGQVLSHILYCSKLILENPSIWNTPVQIGDSKGFGTTYKDRALKYIQEADHVMDHWILPRFVRLPDKLFYFPGPPNEYMTNGPAPWNQLFMLTNGFIRLIQCHVLLADASSRVTEYDAIVKANLDWFFSSSNLKEGISKAGTKVYTFPYRTPSGMEDNSHFAFDVEGLWIAFDSGRYGLTAEDLLPFANIFVDVILGTVTDGLYAGKIDGTTGSGNSGGVNYIRDEYIYLTEFRPEQYERFAYINQSKIPTSPQITARFLWMKNRRHLTLSM